MISCFLTKSNHSRFTYLDKIVDGILTAIVPGLDDKKSFSYRSLQVTSLGVGVLIKK